MRDTYETKKAFACNLGGMARHNAPAKSGHGMVITLAVTVFFLCAITSALAENSERQTNTSSALARLYNFCSVAKCADGTSPTGLVQGLDGNFYGTTYDGGIYDSACSTYGCGTIYKITPSGKLTTLYYFCSQANCSDGTFPVALILGNDGNFYGITRGGGTTNIDYCPSGCGTLFRLTPQGSLTTLVSFDEYGLAPSQVLWGSGETLYGATEGLQFQQAYGQVFIFNAKGTTTFIGPGNSVTGVWFQGTDSQVVGNETPTCDQYCTVQGGWVYKMSADGTSSTILYNFCPTETNCTYYSPGSMTQGVDGNFYGTVGGGTTNSLCTNYGSCGAVYQLTPAGAFTPIHNFCSLAKCADGESPYGLLAGSDGNIYGEAGPNAGIIFKLTPGGTASTVYTFCSLSGCGEGPSGLMQATDGTFYGTTAAGGSHAKGTVYHLAAGLPSFVHPLATFGAVGTKVRILGSNLIGTTGVFFNGTPAAFEVGSKTNLTATVPAGATTGVITVTTPKGTLSSNVLFGVQ